MTGRTIHAPADIQPSPTRRTLAAWLLRTARPVLPPLGLSLLMRLCNLAGAAALLAVGAYGIGVAATAPPGDRADGLWPTLLTMAVLATLRALSEYGEQFAGHFVAFRALTLLRVRFYERLEPQAPAAVSGKKTGDLLSRVTRDIDRIEVFFAHTLAPATSALLLPLAAVIWILCVAPLQLVLPAILIWALMALAVPRIGAASSLAAARRQRRDRGEIAQHITDSVQGLREVLAFDAGLRRLEALDELGIRVAEDQAVSGRWSALRRGVNTLLTLLLPLATLLIGLPLVSQDRLGLPILLAILAVTLIATKAVLAIEEFLDDLDQAFASAARVRQVFDRPPETPEPEHPRPAPQGPVDVRFQEVHFA